MVTENEGQYSSIKRSYFDENVFDKEIYFMSISNCRCRPVFWNSRSQTHRVSVPLKCLNQWGKGVTYIPEGSRHCPNFLWGFPASAASCRLPPLSDRVGLRSCCWLLVCTGKKKAVIFSMLCSPASFCTGLDPCFILRKEENILINRQMGKNSCGTFIQQNPTWP